MAAFGCFDVLLNIAGAVPQIDLFEMSEAQWDDGLALKLHGGAVARYAGFSGEVRIDILHGQGHDAPR
ncbi:MAG: hypothetical protein ACREFJ_08945 [Acetobacteraceae bacterium]